jgi:hypothetical protein
MRNYESTIPHGAGAYAEQFKRRKVSDPINLREEYSEVLNDNKQRMERFMGTANRARTINLNHTDPSFPVVMTPGTNWFQEVVESQSRQWGKSRMVVDREMLRHLPGSTW